RTTSGRTSTPRPGTPPCRAGSSAPAGRRAARVLRTTRRKRAPGLPDGEKPPRLVGRDATLRRVSTATIRDVVAELRAAVDGEVDASDRRRAEYSTDASNYRVVPQAVVAPRHVDQPLAAQDRPRGTAGPATARGADA